jgi:hypothetical protein
MRMVRNLDSLIALLSPVALACTFCLVAYWALQLAGM